MDSLKANPTIHGHIHIVALPYPGRGHIYPMMNLCKILASKNNNILVTFVVTEEWLGFIGFGPKPDNIRFSSIPNVIPTKLEAPSVQLPDRIELPPVTVILADTFLFWAVSVGNRRNIPVAAFWTSSPSMLMILQHFDLLVQNGHFTADISDEERVEYIPGISSTRRMDIPLDNRNQEMTDWVLEIFSWVSKAQYLLFTAIYELESKAIDVLKENFSFPVYAMGPTIHDFDLGENTNLSDNNYLHWLDCQPKSSVLYISMGSFLSVSCAQMDEIVAGLRDSGVRFLWVARDETYKLKEVCGNMGLIVPWCDQLRVLSHSSIGGFLSHCGWNSTREGMFYGLPFLTFPIAFDQVFNSKLLVEDWKIGWRMKQNVKDDNLVTRVEIAKLVQKFMDLESDEVKEIRTKAGEVKQIRQCSIAKGGLSEMSINDFIKNLLDCHGY
ncbi:hypothetical protein ACB098_08G064800 [Castanea mollissima]